MLDEALTWDEAYNRCRQGDNAYLAVANNVEEFDFLRGMYDEYHANGGSAEGVWIDGKFDPVTSTWNCESNYSPLRYQKFDFSE